MRLFYALVFGITMLMIAIYQYKKTKDIISPMVFYSLLTAVRYVPGFLYIEENLFITIDSSMVRRVFIYEMIAVTCTLLGYSFWNKVKKKYTYEVEYSNKFTLELCGAVLYAIGAIFGVIYLYRAGGIGRILSGIKGLNPGNGNSYFRALIFLMVVGICFVIKGRHDKGKKQNYLLIVFLYLGYALIFVIQTSRSPVLEALMIIIMVYHYNVRRINIIDMIKPKYIPVFLLAVLFVIAMPMIRTKSGFKNVTVSEVASETSENVSKIFDEFCYVGKDGFIYENYTEDNYWYGSNAINLICAPIPSRLISWKPPVDDGMYLANAVVGYQVKPPAMIDDLPWYNSYPMSTPGGMYINFGLLGLIVGSLIMGILYSKIYSSLKEKDYDVVSIVCYQAIVYQLELTSLSIVQTLTPMVVTILFARLFCGRKVRMYRKRVSPKGIE